MRSNFSPSSMKSDGQFFEISRCDCMEILYIDPIFIVKFFIPKYRTTNQVFKTGCMYITQINLELLQ